MAEKSATERMDRFESLPTLPAVVVRVLEVVLDSESSAKDAAEIIASDPALAAKVLKIVNSPAYGLRQKISTIGHAVAMLGFATLKGLVLSVSVFDELLEKGKPAGLDKAMFWQHSLAVAAAAKSVAAETGYDLPEEAYVAGLLHDVGKVAMDFTMKEKYAAFLARLKAESLDQIAMEPAELGISHADAGSRILARWNLPLILQQAVRHHHEEVLDGRGIPERAVQLASIVHLADFMCWAQWIGSIEVPRPPALAAQAESRVKLDRRKTDKVMEAVELELKRLAEIFNLQVPDLKRFRQALLRANVELGRINSLYDQARRQLERQVTELTELNEAIRRARQTLDPEKVRHALLEGVQKGLGFDRAFFFIVDEIQKTLAAADMSDSTNVPMGPSTLVVEAAAARPLLERCSSQPDPFLLDQAGAPGSDILLRYLDVEQAAVAPIQVQGGLVGLLVSDNAFTKLPVSETSLQSLAILAAEGSLALENARLFQKTKELATRDALTNVFNRRQLLEALTYEIDRAKRYKRAVAVAMADIDYFKKVNDTLGHLAGDSVLKDVALIIQGASRDADIVGRYGGEEFMTVLPETDVNGGLLYAERVRRAVERYGSTQVLYPGITLTISIGVSGIAPGEEIAKEALIDKADRALYAAKERGRNRVCSI